MTPWHFVRRSTDEVFNSLEENQVALGTMKASRFVKPFAQEVDKWERMLSQILEVTEMLLLVQRLWLYMEVSLVRDWWGVVLGGGVRGWGEGLGGGVGLGLGVHLGGGVGGAVGGEGSGVELGDGVGGLQGVQDIAIL